VDIAIERLAAISFLIIGVSHLLQARAWVDFFVRLRDKGPAGSLQLGLLHLPLALLIVSFHNIWHGWPMVVTVIGWAQLLKAVLYLAYPKHGLRMLGTTTVERSWQFVAGGIFSIALSGLIFLSLWQRGQLV
jgi:hypothetical protein